MNQKCSSDLASSNSPALAARIERVLFPVNLLLTILATILIFRQRRIVLDMLQEFGVEIPSLTLLALNPAVVAFFPALGVFGVLAHFMITCAKRKLAFQIVQTTLILLVTILFVSATLPVTMKLIDELS